MKFEIFSDFSILVVPTNTGWPFLLHSIILFVIALYFSFSVLYIWEEDSYIFDSKSFEETFEEFVKNMNFVRKIQERTRSKNQLRWDGQVGPNVMADDDADGKDAGTTETKEP